MNSSQLKKVEKTFVEGKLVAKYHGVALVESQHDFLKEYTITIYDAKIEDTRFGMRQGEEEWHKGEDSWYALDNIKAAKIAHPDSAGRNQTIYHLDLVEVKIFQPILEKISQEENTTFGTITGTVVGLVEKKVDYLVKVGDPLCPVFDIVNPRFEKIVHQGNKQKAIVGGQLVFSSANVGACKDGSLFLAQEKLTLTNLLITEIMEDGDLVRVRVSGETPVPIVDSDIGEKGPLLGDDKTPKKSFGAALREVLELIPLLFAGLIIIGIVGATIEAIGVQGIIIIGAGVLLILALHFLPGSVIGSKTSGLWRWLFSTTGFIRVAQFVMLALVALFLIVGVTVLALWTGILLLLTFLFSAGTGTRTLGFAFSGLGLVFAILIGLGFIVSLANNSNNRLPSTTWSPALIPNVSSPDQMGGDTVTGSSLNFIVHKLKWEDYQLNQHSGQLIVYEQRFINARDSMANRSQKVSDLTDFGYLCQQIFRQERAQLNSLIYLLDSIQAFRQFDQLGFAELAVSLVQEIPYVLLMSESCPANSELLCIPDVPFGLYSPLEFMYTLAGDCDTRSLLLFTLLDHYGYAVAILASLPYEHAMLGIDLPISGDYLSDGNHRYYFWETTNKGWQPGDLSPLNNNLNLWEIILTNKTSI